MSTITAPRPNTQTITVAGRVHLLCPYLRCVRVHGHLGQCAPHIGRHRDEATA